MRTDYDQHLSECSHCRRRQQIARTIDVLLISVSTLSIAAFLLATYVIHRVELVTHIFTMHLRWLSPWLRHLARSGRDCGSYLFTLLWILVAIATPLPGFLGGIVQEHLPADLRERFRKTQPDAIPSLSL